MLCVVPIQSEAEIACSLPVCVDLLVLFEYTDEVLDVFLVDVLHAEVIDNKAKTDGAPAVSPVTRSYPALGVPRFVESLGEEVLNNDTCLGKTVHATLYLTKYVAIQIDFVPKAVFFDDILWEQFQFHVKVFVSIHGSHEVKILDVDSHEFCIGCGDDAVEHELDCEEISCGCAAVIWIVD